MARAIANDHHQKKANILQQASTLFVAEGFSRISMVQLAEACDISKSNLYHYYRDKESILFSLLDSHMDEILSVLQQTANDYPSEQLKPLIMALLALYRDADHKHRVLLNDLQVLPQAQQDIIRQKERRIVQFFKAAILSEYPDYLSRPQFLSAGAMTVLGAINWSFTWFKPDKGLTVADYADFIANIFRSGLPHVNDLTNPQPSQPLETP